MKLTVNGQERVLEGVDPDMPLLWAIRDLLGLKGTKFGCGMALCGACTVHLDGQPVRSCQTFLADVGDGKVTTIRYQLPAALYAPLRVVLFENEQGRGVFEYDKPSCFFGQYGDERVTQVGRYLDATLEAVLRNAAE